MERLRTTGRADDGRSHHALRRVRRLRRDRQRGAATSEASAPLRDWGPVGLQLCDPGGALTVAVVYDDDVCDAPAPSTTGHQAVSRSMAMRCINGLRQYFTTSHEGDALVGPSAHPLLVEYNGGLCRSDRCPFVTSPSRTHEAPYRSTPFLHLQPPYPSLPRGTRTMRPHCSAVFRHSPGKPPRSRFSDFDDDVVRRAFPQQPWPLMGFM